MQLHKLLTIKRLIFLSVFFFVFIPFFLFFVSVRIKESRTLFEERLKTSLIELERDRDRGLNLDLLYGIMLSLANDPSIINGDRKEVPYELKAISKKTGLFKNILIADKDCNIITDALETKNVPSCSDRPYYKRALEKKDFVFGDFAISRSTNLPVIHFAMPILNEQGEMKKLIIAVPNMEKVFPVIFSKKYLLVDRRGIIVGDQNVQNTGKVYPHFNEIEKQANKSGFFFADNHYVFFTSLDVNGTTFGYLISELKLSKKDIFFQSGFLSQLLLYLSLACLSLYIFKRLVDAFLLKPLDLLLDNYKRFLETKTYAKIDKKFIYELDIFKEFSNNMLEKIEEDQKNLSKEKAYWHDIVNSIPDPLFVVDKNFLIDTANTAFLDAFNLSLDDLNEKYCYELVHNKNYPEIFCPHRDVMERNIHITEELFFEDTKKWFLVSYAPIHKNNEVIGTVHIFKDITKIKEAEEERLTLEKRLLHTQKLESLGVLAGGIAHDFNNFLMGILGNAELALMKKEELPPEVIKYLETIKKVTDKAAHLTRQMLAYSGKGRFVLKDIELNSFIKELLELIKVSISKKASLRLNLDEREPLIINGDPGQIEQVILNLIINASEALEEKDGVITITTGKQWCDKKYFDTTVDGHLCTLPEGDYVFFEISDTGCGMDSVTMSKIFEPFFTTKFTGRGLGLSAILGIVRGHGGAIRVYSEVGKGTTFKIIFPKGSALEKNRTKQQIDKNLAGKVILVVDDESVVRDVTKVFVELYGGTAILAKDGNEAVDLFKKNFDKIDIVLLDLTMPGLSGDETFRELKRIKEDVYVILMSGYNEQEISQKLVGRGFAGFLQKPFTLESLLQALKKP